MHRDIKDVDIAYDVEFSDVLTEGPDGNSVGAVAEEALDEDGGAVGFEGDAVCGRG